MSTTSYSDAIESVLERLRGVGYEFAPSHVNHAPMAAEAMAWPGYTDEVSVVRALSCLADGVYWVC